MTRRLLILILALASCACNRSRNIPDDELVAITRDISCRTPSASRCSAAFR